jgi:hypothetical protein
LLIWFEALAVACVEGLRHGCEEQTSLPDAPTWTEALLDWWPWSIMASHVSHLGVSRNLYFHVLLAVGLLCYTYLEGVAANIPISYLSFLPVLIMYCRIHFASHVPSLH